MLFAGREVHGLELDGDAATCSTSTTTAAAGRSSIGLSDDAGIGNEEDDTHVLLRQAAQVLGGGSSLPPNAPDPSSSSSSSSSSSTGGKGKSKSNRDFYDALSLAAAAVGQGHLSLLFTGIAQAEVAIGKLDKVYNALPREVERFAEALESVRRTLGCTLEECGVDGTPDGLLVLLDDDDGDDGSSKVPPQVLEIAQLIAEGEDFLRDLAAEYEYSPSPSPSPSPDQQPQPRSGPGNLVTVVAKQLLSGNDCPCSKLSQLSEKIREAEAKLHLYRAVQAVRRRNEEEVEEVRRQMEELRASMQELADARRELSRPTEEARRVQELLTDTAESVNAKTTAVISTSKRRRIRKACSAPARWIARAFRGGTRRVYSPAADQMERLKDRRVLNELFDGMCDDSNEHVTVTPEYVQRMEDARYPLRVETPIPANEEKRLRVLRDLRLVQSEMGGPAVGNGFEYHRNELIRTVVTLLRGTLPECEPFALQVVGDTDSYTLTGEHGRAPVTPRSQVPCQHVMCLATSDRAKMRGAVDGYTSDNVLAINLRGRHSELTKNFCYTPQTRSYVGAAVRVSGVTVGSLCMASTKSIEELNWNQRKSAFVRKVATVLEEQITRLCVDWTLYKGELPEDWGLLDVDKILADAQEL